MATLWDKYCEIRKRALSCHTKDDLIYIILEMEKLIAKISKREEQKHIKEIEDEKD